MLNQTHDIDKETDLMRLDLTPLVVLGLILMLQYKFLWKNSSIFRPFQKVRLELYPETELTDEDLRRPMRSISTYGKEEIHPATGLYIISDYFYSTPNCKGRGAESSQDNINSPLIKNAYLTPYNMEDHQECFWFISIPKGSEFCDGIEVTIHQFEDAGVIGRGILRSL